MTLDDKRFEGRASVDEVGGGPLTHPRPAPELVASEPQLRVASHRTAKADTLAPACQGSLECSDGRFFSAAGHKN